jgi:1-deoxy-D-xylulose-5-phosphate synthase
MKHALSHERIITLEDNVLAGGFGSAVVEFLQDSNIQTPVSRIGWPDKFIPHGTDVDALRRLYGLDFQGILNKVLPHLSPDINSAKMVERT